MWQLSLSRWVFSLQFLGVPLFLMASAWVPGNGTARAFTATNADTIYSSYNSTFFVNKGANGYYKLDNGTGTSPGWWTYAEEIEMAEDVYARSGTAGNSNMVASLCYGFMATNGSSWTYDDYNDDMTWAVIAFSRAFLITSNTTFLSVAESNFDAMFSRGWDTNSTGGGLWWSTAKGGKNACINGPAAIAACYLYNITGDSSYLAKAEACYAWERRVLFNTNSGAIYDSIGTGTSGINTWSSSYNQGTFIGAGNFLYRITRLPFYVQDAQLAGKYAQDSLSSSAGIFPVYGSGDFGGFNGILARWAAEFGRDENLWVSYGPWLNTNGNAAWAIRNSNGLAWNEWTSSTPGGTNVLPSWDCSDTVIIMQVGLTNAPDPLQLTPAAGFTAAGQRGWMPDVTNLNLVLTNPSGSALSWALANPAPWLTVSATSGTIAAGAPATTVQVGLNPAVATNLAAGSYYAKVKVTNQTSGVMQSRAFALVITAGSGPMALTGYNAGVVAANTATANSPGATAFDLVNKICFYQQGLAGTTRGLPPDGVFMSQADGTTLFRLPGFGMTNTLVLGDGYPASATLTLATPQTYNYLNVLACSANAVGTVGTLVLNFTNGTQSPALTFNAPDWFGNATNWAIKGFDRLKLGSSWGPDNDGASNPNLYQTTIDLAAQGLNQPVASITFTKPSNAGSTQTVGIFAVSGSAMPGPANIVNQPVSVTNTQSALGASFTVVASGQVPLGYQWYYSATGTQGSYAALAGQTSSNLTLSATLQMTNAGYFYVVVTNSLNTVTSTVATLSVFRAPVITAQPSPDNLWRFAGATNVWWVGVNAAMPVNYQWCQNGTNLANATGPTNRMTGLQVANSGNYSVMVSNAFGMVTSSVVSLTVVSAPTYPYAQQVLAARPLGYWRLDETSGTIAHDYIGSDNGTYTPKVLLGQVGDNLVDTHKAATFGSLLSSNSCATNLLVDFGTTGNATFSVEAWVKAGTQTTDAGIITKGYGSGGEQFNLDCGAGNHAFRFFVRDVNGNTYLVNSSVTPGSVWHHLVGVCDEANGYVYLYVDGTNVGQTAVGPYVGLLSSPMAMSLGSRQASVAPVNNNQLVGTMEEVAVYGYALSATQIENHFLAATNRAPSFLGNPFALTSANAGQAYTASLGTNASDPNGNTMTFSKVGGPAWLTVAADGATSGTPYSGDTGTNVFLVSVADPMGLSNTATMNLPVIAAPPIVVTPVWQGNQLTLSWVGGIAPYQVEVATNLTAPDWLPWGGTITSNSLQIIFTNAASYFRLYGQ
jgi:hypothetical protein